MPGKAETGRNNSSCTERTSNSYRRQIEGRMLGCLGSGQLHSMEITVELSIAANGSQGDSRKMARPAADTEEKREVAPRTNPSGAADEPSPRKD